MDLTREENQNEQNPKQSEGGISQTINAFNNLGGLKNRFGKQAAAQTGKAAARTAGKMAAQAAIRGVVSTPYGWIAIGISVAIFIIVFLIVFILGKDKYSAQQATAPEINTTITAPTETVTPAPAL